MVDIKLTAKGKKTAKPQNAAKALAPALAEQFAARIEQLSRQILAMGTRLELLEDAEIDAEIGAEARAADTGDAANACTREAFRSEVRGLIKEALDEIRRNNPTARI